MPSDQSIAFLRLVLPDEGEGYYSPRYPYRRGGPPNKYEFVTTIEDLWDLQLSHLSLGDVHFSSCSFKVPTRPITSNVLEKRAFYLDLDFDPDDAARAIKENFVDKLCLPPPILVCSGYHLHAWWPLKKSIDLRLWGRIAKGLKEVFEGCCIPIDPNVTEDLVRLGRCPGTYNHKHGTAREVRFYKEPSFEAYDPSLFDNLAVDEPEPSSSTPLPLTGDPAYYQRALNHIPPPDNYDQALKKGMELHSLGDAGFEIWWNWYSQGREAQSKSCCTREQLRGHWNSFHDGREGDRTLGSLIHDAEKHNFDGRLWPPPRPNGEVLPNGEDQAASLNGFDADDPLALHWHTMGTKNWIKVGSGDGVYKRREYENARKAIAEKQIKGRYDRFTNCTEFILPWEEKKGWQDYSDERKKLNRAVRDYLCNDYGDLGLANVEDALKEISRLGSYNSIVNYLDGLRWDKKPHIDTWLIKYCHAEDTPLNRAIGELVLIAAVRRARRPGAKFDHLLILEGDEGIGKSRAVQILAGDEKYFSDEPILTENAKVQHELLEGKWFYEISEFHGIRRTEADHLKAFVTRNVDRSRKAYAHDCSSSFRTCVCIVTTNYTEDKYLQEEMGLRRFWPVKIGEVDQNALIRDRDQLFAEASVREKDYGYLDMPEELQEQLRVEQEKRRLDPEFVDALSSIKGTPEDDILGRLRETITTRAIKDRLGLPIQYHSTTNDRKITQAMKKLGWNPVQINEDGKNLRGWERYLEKK